MATIPVPDGDKAVRLSGLIVIGALVFLAIAGRSFRS